MIQVLIAVLFLFIMLAMPFSKQVRVRMFARDGAKCRICGRKWDDGWMLHAAHYDHDKSNPNYDTLEAGRMLCIDCHILDHKRKLKTATSKKERNMHAYAIRKLRECDRRNYDYYKKKPPR